MFQKLIQQHNGSIGSLSKIFFLCLFLLLAFNCSKKKDNGLGLAILALASEEGSSSSEAEALITAFEIKSKQGTISDNEITIKLPEAEKPNLNRLKAKVTISKGATIQPEPAQEQDYRTPVTFTVTAEDGKTTKKYQVTVKTDTSVKSSEALLTSFVINGKSRTTIDDGTIKIYLPNGSDRSNLTVTFAISRAAKINPDPATVKDYRNPVNFTVTAEDGKTKNYEVTVSVEPSQIISSWTAGWKVSEQSFDANISNRTITIDIDSANFTTTVNLVPDFTLDRDPNTVTDWTKEVEFFTNALTNQTYTVKVTVDGKNIIKPTNRNIHIEINIAIGKIDPGETGNFNHIDVSEVTDISQLFRSKLEFNGDITKWDTSKVTNMFNTFSSAIKFNQDIGNWDTGNVKSMYGMFNGSRIFNQDISRWNTSKVTNMSHMFATSDFNKDISRWDTSKVTDMSNMFYRSEFNQDISDWNTTNVRSCNGIFNENSMNDANKPTFANCIP